MLRAATAVSKAISVCSVLARVVAHGAAFINAECHLNHWNIHWVHTVLPWWTRKRNGVGTILKEEYVNNYDILYTLLIPLVVVKSVLEVSV